MRPVLPFCKPIVAVFALVTGLSGLLAAAPAAAETRSTRLVVEVPGLTTSPVEADPVLLAGSPDASTDSWLTSSAQDPQLAFSAVGSHWKDVPRTELQLSVSPDGIRDSP